MSTLNVLYQSDDKYAVFMGVSICSLLENNKSSENIHIYVIDDFISLENKEKLSSMIHAYGRNVTFLSGEKVSEREDIATAFSYTGMRKNTHSYLKMFIDELAPELSGRIVYIDCDTAVTGDLQNLMSMDMHNKTIGMVMDSLATKCKRAIGIPESDRYYNSGVILIDLARWKQRECSKRIFLHIKNIRTYGTVDQDVLNVELKNEIFTLPIEYNLQPIHLDYPYEMYSSVYRHKDPYYHREEIEKAVKSPKIVHYLRYLGEGPWHEGNSHPCTKYFDHYLKMSPWHDYCKTTANTRKIFRVEKWMYRHLPDSVFLRIFNLVHDAMIIKSNRTLSPTVAKTHQ